MKTLDLFLGLSMASLLVMIVVDIILGPKAEFLNAFSVIQRMLGQVPTAGESLIAQRLGAIGELCVVLAANLAVGAVLTMLVRFFVTK